MLVRSLVLTGLVVVTGCAVGASTDVEQTPAPAAAKTVDPALRDNTVNENKSVPPGATTAVDYEKYAGRTSVPYLGIKLEASPGDGMQLVSIAGPFPGIPEAVIVDENFVEIARATGNQNADGTATIVIASPRVASRTLLVRDGLWSRPMTFHVTAGE